MLVSQVVITALNRYVVHHIPTGGFLRAVLENDFMRAVGGADNDNLCCLLEIRDFILGNLPMECYGSKEKVKDWLAAREQKDLDGDKDKKITA